MAAAGATIGNRIAPPRFLAFILLLPLGAYGWAWLRPEANWHEVLTIGFDLAAAVFLLSLIPLMREFGAAEMRRHAAENDANRILILLLATLLAAVVLISISGELSAARGGDRAAMGKLLATLALTWLFANAVYGLHYAHLFYSAEGSRKNHRGGIEFPGTNEPDYRDFAYFAFTLGMTFQTSDVAIPAAQVRHVVLLHSLAAFVFNIGVIAFTINALG